MYRRQPRCAERGRKGFGTCRARLTVRFSEHFKEKKEQKNTPQNTGLQKEQTGVPLHPQTQA